jgi:arginyl-tRNA synthetase
MNPLAELRGECQTLLEAALETAYPGTELPESKYSLPPNPEMGELSSPACFQLARVLRQSPIKISEALAENIPVDTSKLVKKAKAVAGYVNFHVDPEHYGKLVLESIIDLDKEYGFIKAEKPGKVMVEHTSANPISPIHIGNARNSIIGDSLANLLEKRGNEVIIHFLVNDMGRQVAMTSYGWQLLGKPEPAEEAELWIGTIYASYNVINELRNQKKALKEAEDNGRVYEASEAQEEMDKYLEVSEELKAKYPGLYEKLEEKLAEIDDPVAEMVSLNTRYENNDKNTVDAVRTQIQYCLNGFEDSLGRIGIVFDSFDFESDLVWAKAAETVLDKLLASGYVIDDMGAKILDCDKIAIDLGLKERWGLHPEHEIPRLVLVRGDGTTLYTLRDMAYTIDKFSHAERVINVIGTEQTLAQLQLRIALAAIGDIEMADNQLHYAYELVKLPGARMAGRLGRYVTLNDMLNKAVQMAHEEVEERNPELPEEEKDEISKMVGYGAVKYTLLSVDPQKQVTFDWKKALNFETNSAPFIQYSHARTCNILKRVPDAPEPSYGELDAVKERGLVNILAQFPEVFERAAEELQPSNLTSYANMLADKFNSFYATQSVLKAETPGLQGARLKVVDATRVTLRNALEVLGIDAPTRM